MEPQHLEALYPATSREKEISEILGYLKEGKSCQLLAMPGVGRGNLLGFLAYNRTIRIHHLGEKGQLSYHFVLCNFSEMRNRTLFDVMKFIFLELSSSLHERNRKEEFLVVDRLFKDALSYQDELVLFQELKKAVDYLTLERKLTVTFLFERFETYVPRVEPIFFTNLRSLRSRAKYQINFVFSSTRPLEDILDGITLADFYEFIVDQHVYLSLLDKVGLQFRIEYLEKLTKKKIAESIRDEILSLTSGHGKLTRLALEYIFAKEEKVNEKTLLSLKTIQGALTEIWEFLTPDEQQDLHALSKGETISTVSEFLQRIHLLKESAITIPLFAAFTKEKRTGKSEPIIFDSITNVIKKGERTISDGLTSSEFRLLVLLLENPNVVVDREKIIQTVWTDSKTQAGVSDQAVDQLAFRLRKKIEDDPTLPSHIQTIKGRGLRFVQ